jgi:hypothetical protein
MKELSLNEEPMVDIECSEDDNPPEKLEQGIVSMKIGLRSPRNLLEHLLWLRWLPIFLDLQDRED